MVAKIDVNKVELVWPGKYNDDGSLKEAPKVHLPFQVIETINESRASREEAKKPETMSLFDVHEGNEGDTFEDSWKNKLIWGDSARRSPRFAPLSSAKPEGTRRVPVFPD